MGCKVRAPVFEATRGRHGAEDEQDRDRQNAVRTSMSVRSVSRLKGVLLPSSTSRRSPAAPRVASASAPAAASSNSFELRSSSWAQGVRVGRGQAM
jgi:hypothetical protein